MEAVPMWQPDPADIIYLARAGSLSLGSAESLTGGAVSAAVTAVPGASDVWGGAIVAYGAEVKRDLLGVPQSVLDQVGAVSADTALAMAHGARSRLGVDFAVSTTGVAGPLPHAGQEVGVVFIGVVGPGLARATEFAFKGGRAEVVASAVNAALGELFSALGGHEPVVSGNGEQP
ncbi:CinA family protein [Demequina aurantiaca]|uniref:CinA family protein n=1 Tax=Demequina aurantiaca TaxID=676200 RepID=UPI003D35325E